AGSEPFGSDFSSKHCVQLLQCEKEILRAIDFIHYAMLNLATARSWLLQLPSWITFNQSVIAHFDTLIHVVAHNKPAVRPIEYATLTALTADLLAHSQSTSKEEKLYVMSLC